MSTKEEQLVILYAKKNENTATIAVNNDDISNYTTRIADLQAHNDALASDNETIDDIIAIINV